VRARIVLGATLLVVLTALYVATAVVAAKAKTAAGGGGATKPAAGGSVGEGLYSKYKAAVHLLESAVEIHHFTPEKKKQAEQIQAEIRELIEQLVFEEQVLEKVKEKLAAAKNHWFWFFDRRLREEVDRIQLEINDQVRIMDNIVDDIKVHWRRLKPLYGVFSKMFLIDLFDFIPLAGQLSLSLLRAFLIFDVVALIIFGPIAFFFVYLWISLGLRFLLLILSMVLLASALYHVFHLPFVIIEYDPSALEFAAVYVPFVAFFFFFAVFFFGLVRAQYNKQARRIKIE